MGLANFYRRFVKGFATIAKPLTNLTKKASSSNGKLQKKLHLRP